jgi:hypothetical protein
MLSRKKKGVYLLPRLVGTCTISYQEKREGNKKNRVKTNTFVSILVPYSQPHLFYIRSSSASRTSMLITNFIMVTILQK